MNKNEFIRLIKKHQDWEIQITNVESCLNIENIYEIDWINYSEELFNYVLKSNFNEKGIDLIYWFLHEWDSEDDYFIDGDEDSEINTIDDLWEIVKNMTKND